jgi:hypothetical protein
VDLTLYAGDAGASFSGLVAYDAELGDGTYRSLFTFGDGSAADRELAGGVILAAAEADPNADSDGDGIPDWYEEQYSGSNTGLVAHLDGDGDGPDAYAEWVALTDPTDSNSFFHVSAVLPVAGGMVLEWGSSSSRVYHIGWQGSLTDPTNPLAADLPATPPLNTYTDTTHGAGSGGFYGLRVGRAP